MPVQQQNPRNSGLLPVFMSFTILLFRPMAAIAMTIMNLLSSLSGVKISADTPAFRAMVVITDAMIKYSMNIGNDLLRLNPDCFSPETPVASACLLRI